jgi:nucleoside-diphosphate-sugar epimerase
LDRYPQYHQFQDRVLSGPRAYLRHNVTMRVVVMGGTGFIGPHVVRRLLERGHDVKVLRRDDTEADPGSSDAVVHVCALSKEDAETAVRLFRGRTGKLVLLSSGDVYRAYGRLQGTETSELEPMPITEDSRLRTTLYPYRGDPKFQDYEKILVERTVMNVADLPACVLRLPAVYGPGDRHHRFGGWVKQMVSGNVSIQIGAGMAGWRWTHGYVENVADAITIATTDGRTAGRIYNIGEEAVPTMRERLEAVAEVFGWRGTIEVVPDDMPLDFKQDMAVSTARFRAELGFADPVSTEEGLSRTIAWERSFTAEMPRAL